MKTARLLSVLVLAALPTLVSAQTSVRAVNGEGWIWWEAEDFTASTFPSRHAFVPANPREADVLSGGKWIGAEGDYGGKKLTASYDLAVSAPGTYRLYARKFWKHGPFSWTFSTGGDTAVRGEIGRDVPLLDDSYIRLHLGANWVYLGEVTVAAPGTCRFTVETANTSGAVAFDCFMLTSVPFTPRGKIKPGEKYGRAPEGFFPFEPDRDPYAGSAISMRHLNERFAGENGPIAAKGRDLVHSGTGQRVRFWAVNTGMDSVRKDRASVDEQARFWAKRGVNMVRVHGAIWRDDDFTRLDTDLRDRLHYYVAAMKREGIYVHLSTYFPLWVKFDNKTEGFPGYPAKGQHPFAIQFFNPRFQEIQRGWLRDLLTVPNPHAGGVPLAKDPAVAFVEAVNEDSFFFWTFTPYQNVPAPQMEILERQFGDWLKGRHGTVEAALAGWGGAKVRGDDAAAGRAGILPLFEIFNGRSPRARETARFLAEHQRRYFATMRTFLRDELGYTGLTTASNWTVADLRTLYPLERWSNLAGGAADVLDRHGYWSGPHDGEGSSYSVRAGHTYADRSALVGPASTPLWEVNWLDAPTILSEVGWTAPNRFRAEMSVLSAAYGSLQGNDGWFFFASSASGYEQQIGKFAIHTPAVAGQWPATSLIYRRGLVKEAGTALRNEVRLDDLFALKGAPVPTQVNMDKIRFGDVPAQKQAASDAINPLYFLVGRVETAITDGQPSTSAVDLAKYVDPGAKVARSMTGELAWDFGTGLVTIDAPQVNGAVGFLSKKGETKLGTLSVSSPMEYASVLLVSLDDRPLATSRRMLLQVMTEDQNDGFTASGPAGKRVIDSLGGPPLVVRNVAGSVALSRPDAAGLRVTPLDLNGYPAGPATQMPASLPLAPSTLYYLIEGP